MSEFRVAHGGRTMQRPDVEPLSDAVDAADVVLADLSDDVNLPADPTVAQLGEPDGWKFTEEAIAAGIPWQHARVEGGAFGTLYDHGSGMATGDFNGDGQDDILLLNQCGPTGYYLGNGNGTFVDKSALLAQLDDGVRIAVTHGDYDNDGDTDFFVNLPHQQRPGLIEPALPSAVHARGPVAPVRAVEGRPHPAQSLGAGAG